jgi:hypothetical protein
MQKAWEEEMIQKLDVHPFEIEQCEPLFRYCKQKLPKKEQDESKKVEQVVTE